jgi:hypothetical protein
MKIRINNREQELPDEARLIDAILLVRAATVDDPMLRWCAELTEGTSSISWSMAGGAAGIHVRAR